MSGNKEGINPEDAMHALDDNDSVVEARLDDNTSGVIFERRPRTPKDDRDLGLIPDLLSQPALFEEVWGQMQRGEIRDVKQSTNPQVQELVRRFQERFPDAFAPQRQTAPKPSGNPVMRALKSVSSKIRRKQP